MNEFHKWRRGYGDFSPHWCVTDLEEAWDAATTAEREYMLALVESTLGLMAKKKLQLAIKETNDA